MIHFLIAAQRIGLFLALALFVFGCKQIPKVDDHFQRNSPVETVRYFRYCVDAGDYSRAYQTLTQETQDRISEIQFKGLIRFVDVPELDDIGLRDLVVSSEVDTTPESSNSLSNEYWVTLIWESETQYIEYSLNTVKVPGSTWRIDLLSPRGIDFGNQIQ
ncbi:MAG: hypothetical protein CBC13_02990 [Planctomycetia bacterium TMED53]|nr:MAG: hypothetical protein CBC13_02990 [Planctomycetia bacterium TMED53]